MNTIFGLICLIAGTVLITRGLSAALYDFLKPEPPARPVFKMSEGDYLPTWLQDSLMKGQGYFSTAGVTTDEATAALRAVMEQYPSYRQLLEDTGQQLIEAVKDYDQEDAANPSAAV